MKKFSVSVLVIAFVVLFQIPVFASISIETFGNIDIGTSMGEAQALLGVPDRQSYDEEFRLNLYGYDITDHFAYDRSYFCYKNNLVAVKGAITEEGYAYLYDELIDGFKSNGWIEIKYGVDYTDFIKNNENVYLTVVRRDSRDTVEIYKMSGEEYKISQEYWENHEQYPSDGGGGGCSTVSVTPMLGMLAVPFFLLMRSW